MASLLTDQDWLDFKDAIYEAHETFNNEQVIWKRRLYNIQEFNEDPDPLAGYENITLSCLFQGNAFHTWPITLTTEKGEIDRENFVIYFNRHYLRDLGYLTTTSRFNFSEADDRFIWHGLVHKCMGWSDLAHADDEHLLVMLVLKREEQGHGVTDSLLEDAPISVIAPHGIEQSDFTNLSAIVVDFGLSTDSDMVLLPFNNTVSSKIILVNAANEILASFVVQRGTGVVTSGIIPASITYDPLTDQITIDKTVLYPSGAITILYTVIYNGIPGNQAVLEIGQSSNIFLIEQGGFPSP